MRGGSVRGRGNFKREAWRPPGKNNPSTATNRGLHRITPRQEQEAEEAANIALPPTSTEPSESSEEGDDSQVQGGNMSATPDLDFKLCGSFNGGDSRSAAQWLKRLEWELRGHKVAGQIPPELYLSSIELLLVDQAEEWYLSNPELEDLVQEGTPEALQKLTNKLKTRFPGKAVKRTAKSFKEEISKIKQGDKEDLDSYMERATGILTRAGGRDQPEEGEGPLSSLERTVLDNLMQSWAEGLKDPDLRLAAMKSAIQPGQSMVRLLQEVKENKALQERIEEYNAQERQKLKLTFYEDVVKKHMDPSRLNALWASYQPAKESRGEEPLFGNKGASYGSYRPSYRDFPQANSQNPRLQKRVPIYQDNGYQREIPTAGAPKGPIKGNPYITGEKKWIPGQGVLCIKCGVEGHTSNQCTATEQLSPAEQRILKNLIYPDRGSGPMSTGLVAPARYVGAEGYQGLDPALDCNHPEEEEGVYHEEELDELDQGLANVHLQVADPTSYYEAQVNLGESSGTGKRPAPRGNSPMEEKRTRATAKTGAKRTQGLSAIPAQMGDLGVIEPPVSIRGLLKDLKPNINMLDLLAWSPSMCVEMKKAITRKGKGVKTARGREAYGAESAAGVGQVSSIQADTYTKFLNALPKGDRAFQLPCRIKIGDRITTLERSLVQADQGSDLNVISESLLRKLGLKAKPLAEVGFAGMGMRTADHRLTSLTHYTTLCIGVEGIWRDINCFVVPSATQEKLPESNPINSVGLLLGLPWLYAVDAILSIRNARIMVGDASVGETPKEVAGPELIHCPEHNLMLYPKRAYQELLRSKAVAEEEVKESEEDYREELEELTDSEEEAEDLESDDEPGFH